MTRTESYYTSSSAFQSTVEVRVYQGEDEDALKNVLVGNFTVEGLTETRDPNEVLCRMSLDVDGILRVTAIEKRTGKSKQITIQDALREKSEEEIAAARKRLEELFSTARAGGMELFEESETSWEGMGEELSRWTARKERRQMRRFRWLRRTLDGRRQPGNRIGWSSGREACSGRCTTRTKKRPST